MKKVQYFLAGVLFFFAPALAADAMTGIGKITELVLIDGGRAVRISHSAQYQGLGCSPNGGVYFQLLENGDLGNRIYATLLAAKSENKDVMFWVAGCYNGATSYWGFQSPLIQTIYIR